MCVYMCIYMRLESGMRSRELSIGNVARLFRARAVYIYKYM